MKSIQNQYRDLKEGKMSQSNFMRNLRMSMPQYITNVTSFNDAVKILKNKAILTESHAGNDQWLDAFQDALGFETHMSPSYIISQYGDMKPEDAAKKFMDDSTASAMAKDKEKFARETGGDDIDTNEEEEILDMIDRIEQEKAGEEAIMTQHDPYEESLNEGKGKELNPNQIHPSELRMGIKVELEHTDDLDKAKKIALDHLAENPFYYTALKLSGIESPSAPKVKTPVEKKSKKKKEVIQLVDLANQMQKVKMPKAEEKKKLKESNTEERMMFQDLPADPEKYQIKKDMKGKIIQATNDEGNVFSMNDEAIAIDNGEKIKIAGFKEEQGKVKALFKVSTGMFFDTIDIDGLKPVNKGFRPGVNLGASFEKFKKSLEEIVRETIDEYYFDGRDNLVDPIAAAEKQ